MAAASGSLDYWRKYFRSANSGIFEVIEQAVLVAATDCPQEFRSRRDRIVERLYSVLQPRCSGCDRLELEGGHCGPPAIAVEEGEEDDETVKTDKEKRSKAGSSSEGPEDLNCFVSNYSYDEADALTKEMEEANQILVEVQRIKGILLNHHDEYFFFAPSRSENILFESLRRLQLMELSVEVLEATDIGIAVNGLRKHASQQIRHFVRVLVDGWKVLVDEWIKAAPVAGHSSDSTNPSTVDDEEGLPSPPLDEAFFFGTETTAIQLSEFFDEMDEDGDFRKGGSIDTKQEKGRRPQGIPERVKKQQPSQHAMVIKEQEDIRRQQHWDSGLTKKQQERQSTVTGEKRQMKHPEQVMKQTNSQQVMGQARSQGVTNKQSKPFIAGSGPGRPSSLGLESKIGYEMKVQQQHESTAVQRKPFMAPSDKPKYSDEASIRSNLEAAKRKLHEGYQQAENAKKQRTIQVMELHDIPKQKLNNRQPIMKTKNNLRNRAFARR